MIRYQVYAIDEKKNLLKPITYPTEVKNTAEKHFTDCKDVALVSIDERGAIIEVLDIRVDTSDKTKKPKYVNNHARV